MFDLSQLTIAEDADKGAWYQPVIAGKPLPFRWRIIGRHSASWAALDKELRDKQFKQLKQERMIDVDADKIDQRKVNLLARASRGWQTYDPDKKAWVDGFYFEGKLLAFNTATAKQILNHPIFKTWLPDKLDMFIADEANFFTGAESLPKTSLSDDEAYLGEVVGNSPPSLDGSLATASDNG